MIKAVLLPWQVGGSVGADECAWLLKELLENSSGLGVRGRLWLAFLDGECAFCRPPASCSLVELWKCGVKGRDWLAIDAFLGKTCGRLKLGWELHGLWRIICGIFQGGSMSQDIFSLCTVALNRMLVESGLGVVVTNARGEQKCIACICFVDDIVLLATGPIMLQRMLDLASKWARDHRIRWNVSSGKGAYMVWGRGRSAKLVPGQELVLSGKMLPRTARYKYMGVVFSAGGGWLPHLEAAKPKLIRKTGALVAWAHRYGIHLGVLNRVWKTYAERGVMFAGAVLELPASGLSRLDGIQRRCGRMLLGFCRRSPTPAVLGELGWMPWSVSFFGERFSLCCRVLNSRCEFSRWLADASASIPGSWVARFAVSCSSWCDARMPSSAGEWKLLRAKWWKDVSRVQGEVLRAACQSHSRLCNYMPARLLCDGSWDVNNFMYNNRVPAAKARDVSRLIAGGQGLRGGDVSEATAVSVDNCCVWCLLRGVRAVESLLHVVFVCAEYEQARCSGSVRELLESGGADVFLIHNGRWQWRDLRSLRSFFLDVLALRATLVGRRRKPGAYLQELAEANWQ